MTRTALRPPRSIYEIRSALGFAHAKRVADATNSLTYALSHYRKEYSNGWKAGLRGGSRAWENGTATDAYEDGYLDAAAGREKWHLTHCTNHDDRC